MPKKAFRQGQPHPVNPIETLVPRLMAEHPNEILAVVRETYLHTLKKHTAEKGVLADVAPVAR